MYDAFGNGARLRYLNRRTKKDEVHRFSPSFGVHEGLIPDPNWPPVQFPDNSVAMQRKYRRVACSFSLEVEGKKRTVHGDVSEGGAMFLLDAPLGVSEVVVEVRGQAALARVLTSNAKGPEVAYHAQFLDPEQGAKVWRALTSAK
jgi:hypothetical protein